MGVASGMDPEKLKLVVFLKQRIGDYYNPLHTYKAIKIVRKVFNENGKSLSGMNKKDFLARAKEIFENKEVEKDHVCPLCFKTFENWQDRERHVEIVHEKKTSTRFECVSCSKTFTSGSSLKYHTETVHRETTAILAKCNICDIEFSHKQVLQRHNKSVHKQERDVGDIVCEECGKFFTRKDNLTIHKKRAHRIFKVALNDVRRMLAHRGGFKCKMCGQEFFGEKAAQTIELHVAKKCKSDTGVECEQCGAPFTHQYDLKQHMKVKHTSDPILFSCSLCDFTSNYEKSLKRHKKRRHLDQ